MPFESVEAIAPAPALQFSTERGSGDFEFWEQDMHAMYDIDPMESDRNTGRFVSNRFFSERGVVLESAYDRQFIRLTKKHSSQFGNLLLVVRFVSGGGLGESNGAPLAYKAGDIMINDYSRQYSGVHFASELEGVFLEKAQLGYDPCAPLPKIDYAADSAMGKLLHRELDRVIHPLLGGGSVLDLARFERFISCVKLAIDGGLPEGDVRTRARAALKDLICEYIENNLLDPELSANRILREFGVSRASLYRMFEPETGVRNYIALRRLYGAVHDLSIKPRVRGKVHEVSERWGYSSDANFSRSVRRAFGTSPGMLFGAAAPAKLPSPTVETLTLVGSGM